MVSRNKILMSSVAVSVAAIFLAVLAVGCSTATERSDQVNQDRIHQFYTISYDQEKNRTSANAKFRFGDISGTTLRLVGKSHVSHNSYSLRESSLLGTYYSGESSGFQPSHTFVFVDTEGKSYTNSAAIPVIAFSGATAGNLSRSSDFTLSWEGGPITTDETVTVYIEDSAKRELVIGSISAVGATSVTVTTDKLSPLTMGAKTLQLKREKWFTLQQGTSRGGIILATYITSKRIITVP